MIVVVATLWFVNPPLLSNFSIALTLYIRASLSTCSFSSLLGLNGGKMLLGSLGSGVHVFRRLSELPPGGRQRHSDKATLKDSVKNNPVIGRFPLPWAGCYPWCWETRLTEELRGR